MTTAEKCLRELFQDRFNEKIERIDALPQSGSYRQYYRIESEKRSVLGVFNTDLEENKAYLSFSKTFEEQSISVPKIYIVSESEQAYLVEDIGSVALWDIAKEDMNTHGQLSENTIELYKKTLTELFKIQTQTIGSLDLSYCYPRDAFDKQSMLWDLNYFKYFFLRLTRVPVDEQLLENDIQKLSSDLDNINQNYFLYRDFQSRNVMIRNKQPFFIDFQGGRKGSIYYDIASLLYDANVELIEKDREELLDHYYLKWNEAESISKLEFQSNFNKFATIRLTQALGAFGLRGIVEKKPNFKECIPFALASLKSILDDTELGEEYPTLADSIDKAVDSEYIKSIV